MRREKMSENKPDNRRRDFLKLMGAFSVGSLIPLTGCGDTNDSGSSPISGPVPVDAMTYRTNCQALCSKTAHR